MIFNCNNYKIMPIIKGRKNPPVSQGWTWTKNDQPKQCTFFWGEILQNHHRVWSPKVGNLVTPAKWTRSFCLSTLPVGNIIFVIFPFWTVLNGWNRLRMSLFFILYIEKKNILAKKHGMPGMPKEMPLIHMFHGPLKGGVDEEFTP